MVSSFVLSYFVCFVFVVCFLIFKLFSSFFLLSVFFERESSSALVINVIFIVVAFVVKLAGYLSRNWQSIITRLFLEVGLVCVHAVWDNVPFYQCGVNAAMGPRSGFSFLASRHLWSSSRESSYTLFIDGVFISASIQKRFPFLRQRLRHNEDYDSLFGSFPSLRLCLVVVKS